MRRRSTLIGEGTKSALKKTISQKQNNSMKTVNITSEDFIFDFKAYNQEILGKYMTKKEYQTIISELNMVVTKAFITNNKKEKVKIYKFIYVLLLITFIFFISGSVFLVKAHNFKNNHPNELNIPYIIGVLLTLSSIIIVIGLSIYNFKHSSIRMLTIEDTIHSFIRKYVSFLNVYFKGFFKWTYHPKKVLIELTVEDDEIIDDDDNADTNKIKNDIEKKRNKKPIELEKLEELFEGYDNEDDEMIEKKLFGNGWDDDDEYEKEDDTENYLQNQKKKINDIYNIKFNDGKTTELSKDTLRLITENEENNIQEDNKKLDKTFNSFSRTRNELIEYFKNFQTKHFRSYSDNIH